MSELKVATIQTATVWEDIDANLNLLTQKITSINTPVDVIVLPELFTTAFTMNTSLAEKPDGKTMQWMEQMAKQTNAAICGSVMMNTKHNDVYNRLIWMNPNGTYIAYNKHHLFSIGSEHNHYKAGNEQVIINYKGFNIRLLICFDLRFPVWIRRTEKLNYDAIFIVASWPEKRAEHWKILLQARAIENQSYVVAVNRVGVDASGINHSGESSIIAPTGTIIYQKSTLEEVAINTLILENVHQYRKEFPAFSHADKFTIQL